jgi:hypothetical protein
MAKKPEPQKKKRGRPSKFTQELADYICAMIREGISEREICDKPDMPCIQTLWNWKEAHPEFLEQTARARRQSAELYALRAMQVAQETSDFAEKVAEGQVEIGGEPLRNLPAGYVEAKKMLMQQLNREAGLRDDRNFGDRKSVAVTGADGGAVKIEQKATVSQLTTEELMKIAGLTE